MYYYKIIFLLDFEHHFSECLARYYASFLFFYFGDVFVAHFKTFFLFMELFFFLFLCKVAFVSLVVCLECD